MGLKGDKSLIDMERYTIVSNTFKATPFKMSKVLFEDLDNL